MVWSKGFLPVAKQNKLKKIIAQAAIFPLLIALTADLFPFVFAAGCKYFNASKLLHVFNPVASSSMLILG